MPFEWSHLDTSVGSLVRSGSGLLEVLLGSFVLAARPPLARNRLLGIYLVLDGLGYLVFALAGGFSDFPHKDLIVPSHVVSVLCSTAVAILMAAYFWPELRALTRHPLALALGVTAFTVSAAVTPFLVLALGESVPIEVYGTRTNQVAGNLDSAAFGLFAGVAALSATALLVGLRREPDRPGSKARFLFALSLVQGNSILAAVFLTNATYPGLDAAGSAAFILNAAVLLGLLPLLVGLGRVGGLSRWWPTLALLLFLVAGVIELLLLATFDGDRGFGGVVGLLGLACLALAIFRHDLLGVPVPRPRAGFLAAVGLAALFVTAQVAQNFLSDGLGLLWGGIVAGIVVFAAGPLQRWMERRASGGTHVQAFRTAARLALRDGRLSRAEELDLLELAHGAGLSPKAAAVILDEEAKGRRKAAQ